MTGIYVTLAASDAAHVQFLAGLNRPDVGVVSVRVRPDMRRLTPLVRDLLAAVGVRRDVAGAVRNANESEYQAIVWLVANRVTDVVVAGVEALPEHLCSDLIRVAHVAGVRLWLVGDHVLPDALLGVLADWPVVPVPQHEFDARFAALSERRPGDTVAASPFPVAVPSADFPVFLAETRRLLSVEDAQVVEARYVEAVETAGAMFDRVGHVDVATVVRVFVELASDTAVWADAVTVTRGVQVAAFVRGWFVQVNLRRLLGQVLEPHAALLNRAMVDPLRAYSQPYRGALCVLAAAGWDISDLDGLRVGSVTRAGDMYESGVPQHAQVFLRAMRFERVMAGALGRHRLFTDHRGQGIGPRMRVRAVDDAARELGFVAVPVTTAKTTRFATWMDVAGVSVQALGVVPRDGASC